MYQFNQVILKDGVLYDLYAHNDVEYHQLVLLQRYHKKVLQSLHDDLGHQGIDWHLMAQEMTKLDFLTAPISWKVLKQPWNCQKVTYFKNYRNSSQDMSVLMSLVSKFDKKVQNEVS